MWGWRQAGHASSHSSDDAACVALLDYEMQQRMGGTNPPSRWSHVLPAAQAARPERAVDTMEQRVAHEADDIPIEDEAAPQAAQHREEQLEEGAALDKGRAAKKMRTETEALPAVRHEEELEQRAAMDEKVDLSVSVWLRDEPLVRAYAAKGVTQLHHWQVHCLREPGVEAGSANLVYSAPTGGGKTLVAEILMLRRLLEDNKAKAMFIVPLAALAEEKAKSLSSLFEQAK